MLNELHCILDNYFLILIKCIIKKHNMYSIRHRDYEKYLRRIVRVNNGNLKFKIKRIQLLYFKRTPHRYVLSLSYTHTHRRNAFLTRLSLLRWRKRVLSMCTCVRQRQHVALWRPLKVIIHV